MTNDLAAFAAERGVKYFMISYTDLFGGQRAKLVPTQAIAEMQADGAGFAGFATWLDLTPAHPDIFALPDPASVIQLPWRKEVAWVAADCTMEDAPIAQAPRVVLKRLVAEAGGWGTYDALPFEECPPAQYWARHALEVEDGWLVAYEGAFYSHIVWTSKDGAERKLVSAVGLRA